MTKNNNLNKLLNQARSLIEAKEFDKAIPIYEAILAIDNMHIQALSHLSIIYLMNKRYEESIDMINRSFEIIKPVVGDYQNLASAYVGLKDYNNAINTYKKIIEIDPNILQIHKFLGDAQIEVADHVGAFNSYRHALKLAPGQFQQLFDYGATLHVLKKHEEALEYLLKAHKLDLGHLECMNKRAACFSAIGDYREAKLIYQKLMALVPDALAPVIDYASCLNFEGKYDEAVKLLKEAIVKKPYNNIAKSNLGCIYLTKKKFKEGWEYYEARIPMRNEIDVMKRYDMLKTFFDIDVGKKELKTNEKIIILQDAGIGDAILSLSMLKEFHKKYRNISVEADYRLVDLFKRSFPDVEFYPFRENRHEILIKYNLSLFDKGIYWMSLGKYVRQEIADFPKKEIAFLQPDINKVNEIKNKIKKKGDVICGVSWKSVAMEDRHKTAQLKNLLPIFSIKNIRFIDLQYETKNNLGETALEKKNLFKNNNIKIEEYKGIDKFEDIDDLTALISNCDIVVTSSNVTAHIAGGLGIKTFLFVPFSRGRLWYWHDEGDKSIWYPSIKIFRAESGGVWGTIFEKMAEAIKQELNL